MVMESWFDIKSIHTVADGSYDKKQFKKSASRIKKVLKKEIELLEGNSKKVCIGGFN